MCNIEDFTAAVKYVAKRTGDLDLAQDAALFAWEHLDELRGPPRAWLLTIAWQLRRWHRRDLSYEIDATRHYTDIMRSRSHELPEQEHAVLLRELVARRDLAPVFSADASRARLRGRAAAAALLAA
jgi:DNA-directed RNA polymerase specialized sigma24 family protein